MLHCKRFELDGPKSALRYFYPILRRTDDWMSLEYEVLIKHAHPSNDLAETKLLGRVVDTTWQVIEK